MAASDGAVPLATAATGGALLGGAACVWLLGLANPVWAGGAAIAGVLLVGLVAARAAARPPRAEGVDVVNRFQARFLNAAAHELGTPLTPLVLQVRGLERELADAPSRTRERLAIIERNVGRLQRIVADLVRGAELSVVPRQPRHTQADLGRVVRDAVQELAPDLQEAGVGVGVQVDGPADVAAPPGPLGYVVKNLLREAIQYREKGTRIDLTIERDGAAVHLLLWSQGWKVAQAEWDPGLFLGEQGGQASLAIYLAAAMADRHGWGLSLAGVDAPGDTPRNQVAQVRLTVPAGESWRQPKPSRRRAPGNEPTGPSA